jgi:hypothetical protein
MTYVFRDTEHTATLIEMTPRALAKQEALQDAGRADGPDGEVWPRYTRTSADRAHRWVRDGGHHETALYVDIDRRIRRAG